MERVYIISRYRADTHKEQEFNLEVARHFCRKIIDEGNIPVAPHLYYTQFLDDSYPKDRELGLSLGLQDLRKADRFLMVVGDGQVSEGMKGELIEASRYGIYGEIITVTKENISEEMKVVR